MRVAVVGGGVAGLCCAYQLQRRGCAVTVLEASRCGDGASRGNAGWITPFLSAPRAEPGAVWQALQDMPRRETPARVRLRFEPDFAVWLWRFWRSCRPARYAAGTRAMLRLSAEAVRAYERLRTAGIPLELHHDGLLVATRSSATLDRYVRLHTRLADWGYAGGAVALVGRELRAFEPALHEAVYGGLYLPAEASVRPETVTGGIAGWLSAAGASVREQCPVQRLIQRPDKTWTVQTRTSGDVVADRLLVAAGVTTKTLLAPLGIALPLEAARGTSVTIRRREMVPKRPLKLAEHMVACTPFKDAWRLSGTFDLGDRRTQVDERRLAAVIRAARRYLGDVSPEPEDVRWAGLRPVTPDDLPILGPVDGYDGLYLATGYGTLGMTLGPAAAELLAPLVLDAACLEELRPFSLSRFAFRPRRTVQPEGDRHG